MELTHHVPKDETLNWMKHGAGIVKAARGEFIETTAYIDALKSGRFSRTTLETALFNPEVGDNHQTKEET